MLCLVGGQKDGEMENGGKKYIKFSFPSCLSGWENEKVKGWKTTLFG